MKAKSIFVLLVILLLLNPAGATVPSDWTTGVQKGDLITMMNPIRLSICKVLKENVEIASRELRDTLGLSWGDFSTHITALKKRGFIHSYSKFEDGMEKQYMSLEPEGEKRFSELVDLLLNFLVEE